MAKDYFVSL